MVRKDSYNFDMKRKYRQKLEEFIAHALRRELKDPKRRKSLTVACFPGHEGLEILNVYDKLGIERENIVGIEAKPDIAAEISDLNLGIRVFEGYDYEFFEQDHEGFPNRFDVVNLDYQGYLDEDKRYALVLILGRPVLKPIGVLGINCLGKRERDNVYGLALNNLRYSCKDRELIEAVLTGDKEKAKKLSAEVHSIIQKSKNYNLGDSRSDGLTAFLLTSMSTAKDQVELMGVKREMLEKLPTIKEIIPDLLEQYDAAKTQHERTRVLRSPANNFLTNILMADLQSVIRTSRIGQLYGDNESLVGVIASYLIQPEVEFKKVTNLYRGKYISDKRAPMFFDFFRVVRYDVTAWEKRPKIEIFRNDHLGVHLPFDTPSIVDFVTKAVRPQAMPKYFPLAGTLPERVMLGSSYKPESNLEGSGLEIITREEALEFLQADCTPAEIAECYSGFTVVELEAMTEELKPVIDSKETAYQVIKDHRDKGIEVNAAYLLENCRVKPELESRLPAYIAWDTMHRQKSEKSERRSWTGQDVVDALAVMDEDAVKEQFSLSDGSLRAIKAHQTMGRYEEPTTSYFYQGSLIEGKGDVTVRLNGLLERYNYDLNRIPARVLDLNDLSIIDK